MINEQIEQYRKIVEGAPEGATHYTECANDKALVQHYLKYDEDMDVLAAWHSWWDTGAPPDWCDVDEDNLLEFNQFHSLNDLRTIIAQHDELQRLKGLLTEICCAVASDNDVVFYALIDDAKEALNNE